MGRPATPDGIRQGACEKRCRAASWHQKSPLRDVTPDDISAPLKRLPVENITGHQPIRGRGRLIAVMYKTHWTGLSKPSCEREAVVLLSRHQILRYWAGTPNQHRHTNSVFRGMRTGAAQRELLSEQRRRFLAPGYGCVPRADLFRHYRSTVLPNGSHLWYKSGPILWLVWGAPAQWIRSSTHRSLQNRPMDDPHVLHQ